jgi:predicted acyltransferase
MARLLLLIRVGPEHMRLHAWLYTHLFAPWAAPVNASLAFALAYVLLWCGLMWLLQRTGLRLRV